MQTQKNKILDLLIEAGEKGINSYGIARDLALQLPARIWDLKNEGNEIISIDQPDGSVNYVLYGQERKWKWEFHNDKAVKVYS